MELSFTKGTFVSNPGELNYKQVLEDFQRANTIRILTYNISGNYKNDTLLSALSDTNADIQYKCGYSDNYKHSLSNGILL